MKATARRFLPEPLAREARRYRGYGRNERITYAKLRLLNAIGLAAPKRPRFPPPEQSLLFVCFGNIIRSPMCEALMSRALAGLPQLKVNVTSAGLNATAGRAAHPWAISAARQFGISLQEHRARVLTGEMVREADAIFVMDYENHVQLLSRWSESKNKVHMLGRYAGENHRSIEIADPYYLSEEQTLSCYRLLNACIQNLASCLSGISPSTGA